MKSIADIGDAINLYEEAVSEKNRYKYFKARMWLLNNGYKHELDELERVMEIRDSIYV